MNTLENQKLKLNLKRVYQEICLGYSPFSVLGENLYFKHLSVFDKIKCDEFYEQSLNIAVRLGKKTEKEIFEEAKSDGRWTKSDEKMIESYKRDLLKMSESRSKSLDPDQIEEIEEIIAEYDESLRNLYQKKSSLLESSAESHATNEYVINFILESVYLDKDLKTQKWNNEEKPYKTMRSLDPFFKAHSDVFSRFSNDNVRKIAIADYFQQGFSLVSDMSQFFNKKVFDLSDYQVKLLKYGNYFKDILTESHDAPDDYQDDPDKLEQWYIIKKNRSSNPDYQNAKDGEKGLRNFIEKENV